MVHNSVVQTPPPGYEYDGIAEWWFASAEAARAALDGGDVRSQLPEPYNELVDLQQSVFLFTQVTHQRP